MTQKVLLLGSTDFTLAVADAIKDAGAKVGAIAHVGETFRISYAREGVKNYRSANIAHWCAANGAKPILYSSIADLEAAFGDTEYDLAILAGWYHMVPLSFARLFSHGCAAFHASLLPKLRGGAPLSWAILSELTETGLTLFEVGEGVDDGGIYDQERFSVTPQTYVADLVRASHVAAVTIIRRSLPAILAGELRSQPQHGEPSYCVQRAPEDGRIDWGHSAVAIDRLVRAVSRPYPGGIATLGGDTIAIHRVRTVAGSRGLPGAIVAPATVACGAGCIVIEEAMLPDGTSALNGLTPGRQFS